MILTHLGRMMATIKKQKAKTEKNYVHDVPFKFAKQKNFIPLHSLSLNNNASPLAEVNNSEKDICLFQLLGH